jgi:outer membrane immunogenic protein
MQGAGTSEPAAAGFGGFVGYNFQWENVIMGLELTYTHASLNANAPSSPLTRALVGGIIESVTVNASGSLLISDFATTRARFGWAIDNFLPLRRLRRV